jgi:ribosomal protein S18 acetylase RimI-like enzyme
MDPAHATVEWPMNQHRSEARMNVEIIPFRAEHSSRFAELNREWLTKYDLMERSDEEQLADPQAHFLADGGQIFVALNAGEVIGTCAAVPHGVDAFEIAKLAVAAEFRGQAIARRLVARCIAYVREQNVRRIVLVSNSQLQAALGLYESLGFRYCALPEVRAYRNADVYMELNLDIAAQVRAADGASVET